MFQLEFSGRQHGREVREAFGVEKDPVEPALQRLGCFYPLELFIASAKKANTSQFKQKRYSLVLET